MLEQITAFRAALQTAKQSQPFRIDAMAVRDPGFRYAPSRLQLLSPPEQKIRLHRPPAIVVGHVVDPRQPKPTLA